MNLIRCIVAGSRSFNDYPLMEREVRKFLKGYRPSEVEIVSGKCPSKEKQGGPAGADALGERFAKEKGCKVAPFPADWKAYGRGAGPIRNKEMAQYADACICFWDGVSNGTRSMISLAEEHNLELRVVLFGEWLWYAHPESSSVFISFPTEGDGLLVELGPVAAVTEEAVKKIAQEQGYDISKETIDLTIPCH